MENLIPLLISSALIEIELLIILAILSRYKSKSQAKAMAEAEILEQPKKARKFRPHLDLIKTVKFLIILIPVLLILFVFYSNFIAAHNFNYYYDIGSSADAKKSILSPLARISETANDSAVNYRNLTSQLVYFDVPIPSGSDSVKIEARFKNIFPESATLSLGAKDSDIWHYKYKSLYSPLIELLKSYNFTGNETRIYKINPEMPLIYDEKSVPKGSVVASNILFSAPVTKEILDTGYLDITTSLRGGHTFFVYLKGSLRLNIMKQDLNWYNNSDELVITLSYPDGTPIVNATIADDGITAEAPKTMAKIQSGGLDFLNLKNGVYKLEFSDFDGLIRKISINTDKMVTNRLFLADNQIYVIQDNPARIFTSLSTPGQIAFLTYHSAGEQQVKYNGHYFPVRQDKLASLNLPKGEYFLDFPKNDLIVSSPNYLSFSRQSYFEPFDYKLIPIPSNISLLKNNIDYLISDYGPVKTDKDWIASSVKFDLKDLYIKDGKLSMLFNAPHLANNETSQYTLPVDWIKITVRKNGIF